MGRTLGSSLLELLLLNVFPRALGMLLRAAHAGSEVLQTVHVETATTIAGRHDTFAPLKLLHARYHLYLERTTVILLGLVGLGWR